MEEQVRNKSSYEKINYSLRPAKNIERKMLCEAITRLSLIQNLGKYRYIGFGSPYFTDFILLHRMFGINDLISIEKDKFNKDRFEFNKPYSCIKMIFKNSHEALTEINHGEKPSIVWLDYDQRLDSKMLEDIRTYFSSASAGSMFIITVSVKPDDFERNEEDEILTGNKTIKQLRIDKLVERIGKSRLPYDINELNLGIEENPPIIYNIIANEIGAALAKQNGRLAKSNTLMYKQIFNFLYDDGTLMLTVGGIIFDEKQKNKIEEMNFTSLDFIREKNNFFYIKVPCLTFKEIRVLDSLLPKNIYNLKENSSKKKRKNTKSPPLEKEDIANYSKIYRYFPNFAESSL